MPTPKQRERTLTCIKINAEPIIEFKNNFEDGAGWQIEIKIEIERVTNKKIGRRDNNLHIQHSRYNQSMQKELKSPKRKDNNFIAKIEERNKINKRKCKKWWIGNR